MSNLLESCRQHFDTDNLYDVLGLKKNASDAEGNLHGIFVLNVMKFRDYHYPILCNFLRLRCSY